ncbi:MAG: ice-binding family protein [Bacteroidota bacterium]
MKTFKTLISFCFGAIVLFAACKKSDNPTPTNGSLLVVMATPSNNATGIIRNISVSVTFNLAIDSTTLDSSSFTMQKGSETIAGIITYKNKAATFTPIYSLEANTLYTVKLSNKIKTTAGVILIGGFTTSFTTSGTTATLQAVSLGSAGNYVILAKTAINNVPTSSITGDLGLSPAATSYITGLALTDATGYATSAQVTGKVYAADMAPPTAISLTTAVTNMITAYNDAAGRPTPDFAELGTGNIGGKTLSPGLYKWSSGVTIPASITLLGGPNDVWIFQIAGNLDQSAGINMVLAGGTQAKNIFWQVAGEVTIGTTAHIEGVFLSQTGITLGTGASLNGRALAQTAVILDGNMVVQPQ